MGGPGARSGAALKSSLAFLPNFEGVTEFYQDVDAASLSPSEADRFDVRSGRGSEGTDNIPVGFFYGINDWMPFRAVKLISEKAARYSARNIPVLLLKHSG